MCKFMLLGIKEKNLYWLIDLGYLLIRLMNLYILVGWYLV